MRALTRTPLGRLHLASIVLLTGVLVLNMTILLSSEHPSLVKSSMWPLLLFNVTLALAARGRLIRRDRVTFAVALVAMLTLAAGGAAVDQRYDIAGVSLDLTLPLLGAALLALGSSALGRQQR
jgi:hypothetical protein